MKCLSVRQLINAFLFMAMALPAQAYRCYQSQNDDRFVFQEPLSLKENLESFAKQSGVKIDWGNRWPSLFQSVFGDISKLGFGSSTSHLRFDRGRPEQNVTFTFHKSSRDRKVPTHRTQPILKMNQVPSALLGEKWSANNGEKFRFLNFGSTSLMRGRSGKDLYDFIQDERQKNPGQNLEVPFDPLFAVVRNMINDRQILASYKGIQRYLEKKSYLAPEDLEPLQRHDWLSKDDSDYLALLTDHGNHPLSMSTDEFHKRLVLMMRVARLDPTKNYMSGFINGGQNFTAELPSFDRVPPESKPFVDNFLKHLTVGKGLRIAELSRYNKFAELPEDVQNQFLARVFATSKDPDFPIDLFVIECDSFTSRLFKKFGFRKLAKISSESASSDEFLMYLDTRSRRFNEVYEGLRSAGRSVVVEPETRVPAFNKWTVAWDMPSNFGKHSPPGKRGRMYSLLNRIKGSLKNMIFNEAREAEFFKNVFPTEVFATQMAILAEHLKVNDRVLLTGDAADLVLPLMREYLEGQSVGLMQPGDINVAEKIAVFNWKQTAPVPKEALTDSGSALVLDFSKVSENADIRVIPKN